MPDNKPLSGQSKFSAKAIAAPLVLALAGTLGNHFMLWLFPGIEILFGSIAALIAARTLGLLWYGDLTLLVEIPTEPYRD